MVLVEIGDARDELVFRQGLVAQLVDLALDAGDCVCAGWLDKDVANSRSQRRNVLDGPAECRVQGWDSK